MHADERMPHSDTPYDKKPPHNNIAGTSRYRRPDIVQKAQAKPASESGMRSRHTTESSAHRVQNDSDLSHGRLPRNSAGQKPKSGLAMPLEHPPYKTIYHDNMVIIFTQRQNKFTLASIQFYSLANGTFKPLMQLNIETPTFLFVDFWHSSELIYYTSNYGVFQLNCRTREQRKIYRTTQLTKCPVLHEGILYFVEGDLNHNMTVQDVYIVQFDIRQEKVTSTITLHNSRVIDMQIDRGNSDLVVLATKLHQFDFKSLPQYKSLQHGTVKDILSLQMIKYTYQKEYNGYSAQEVKEDSLYHMLDMPFEELVQALVGKHTLYFTYVKNQNHFYYLRKNSQGGDLKLTAIRLSEFLEQTTYISSLAFHNGKFVCNTGREVIEFAVRYDKGQIDMTDIRCSTVQKNGYTILEAIPDVLCVYELEIDDDIESEDRTDTEQEQHSTQPYDSRPKYCIEGVTPTAKHVGPAIRFVSAE